ncbi:MAG: FtsX-like permease family protein [Clostridium sp.]|nr:FtsX-like permease family protein [Clostridium sp.]MCM1398345.1 FtsX-like permease family protein [Clostridium sp.]MCM1458990.1 FtsX-like permease family protein [Bacteroides sp.]
MEAKILLKANLKKHKNGLVGIFVLMLLSMAALGTALTVWTNSDTYVQAEMERAGFGALTIWVSGIPGHLDLAADIAALPEIEQTELQPLIYSNYTANEQESDSEGQMILYRPEENRYRFFEDDLSGYVESPDKISAGEVYVSPSMVSMFGTQIGDEITFPIARAGKNLTLTVKGFYEDPFMGSSMIGMKGFLISEADRNKALSILQNAGIDGLARDGAMLHIFPREQTEWTGLELNSLINGKTAVNQYSEDVHDKNAIAGFMVILQNAFCGILLAFALVLLFVVLIVIGHSISNTVEADTVNMGILKTIGFTSSKLRMLQIVQYMIPILAGMLLGLVVSIPLSGIVANMTITTIGIRIPMNLPMVWIGLFYILILLVLTGFVVLRTGKISRIKPMQAIRRDEENVYFHPERTISAFGKGLHLRLAYRQLISGKRWYIGALMVAAVLVFFASLIGRMDAWLGTDGKGMMDAFNPADHDIGVQSFGSLTHDEFENTIRRYSDITDTYMLAMPSVAVNGVNYTANVIDQPERFHLLRGKPCNAENEIVLTEFVAESFGVSIGDTVTVRGDSGSGEFIVSGIYSCANDMGDNVGMNRAGYLNIGQDHPNLWCWHYFLSDTSQKSAITKALEDAYGGDVHVHENTWPGLFGIISAMHLLMIVMYVMVAVFILIVTVMTGSKILVAEQKNMGIYKVIGFQVNQLRLTFALRFGMVAVIGALIGVILAAWLTDPIVSAVMKLAGISNFASTPGWGTVLLPASVVVVLFIVFAYIASGKIKKSRLAILTDE